MTLIIFKKAGFLICLKMPVNLIQYRWEVGAFNKIIICFDKDTNENIRFQRLNMNTKTPLELSHKADFP